jgi:hypothetical protein
LRESDLQNQIRIELSKYGLPFRTNSGEFYQGTRIFSKEFQQDVLIHLRRITGLPKGFSDLLFVGDNTVAFIECKKPDGTIRPDQIRFLKQMQQLNHHVGVARNVNDALQIINGGILL